MDETARIDANNKKTLTGVTNDEKGEIRNLRVDSDGKLLVKAISDSEWTVMKTKQAGVVIPTGTKYVVITDVDEIANGSNPIEISTESEDTILDVETYNLEIRGGVVRFYLDGNNYIKI